MDIGIETVNESEVYNVPAESVYAVVEVKQDLSDLPPSPDPTHGGTIPRADNSSIRT